MTKQEKDNAFKLMLKIAKKHRQDQWNPQEVYDGFQDPEIRFELRRIRYTKIEIIKNIGILIDYNIMNIDGFILVTYDRGPDLLNITKFNSSYEKILTVNGIFLSDIAIMIIDLVMEERIH